MSASFVPTGSAVVAEVRLKIRRGTAVRQIANRLWFSGPEYAAALIARSGPNIYDPIAGGCHAHIVLYYDHSVA
jgi:hypothetical protein